MLTKETARSSTIASMKLKQINKSLKVKDNPIMGRNQKKTKLVRKNKIA